MSFLHLVYGGNGVALPGGELPRVGEIYAVEHSGEVRWYRYEGHGESRISGSGVWNANSETIIATGWQDVIRVFAYGDGVLFTVDPNGDLRWHQYLGHGESDPVDGDGWHANSGNPVGNGWQGFTTIFSVSREGFGARNRSGIFGVDENGDLRWYRYEGTGEADVSGATGWHPNSGNTIGRGWNGLRLLTAVSDAILVVDADGDLRWYRYEGDGEQDPAGANHWDPRSGTRIATGWGGFTRIFGGWAGPGTGYVVFAVQENGDLRWFRYQGHGEPFPSLDEEWNLFALTDPEHVRGVSPYFLMAPRLAQSLDGPAVERVLLARDEGANLAWAIEQRVEDDAGEPRERYDEWVAGRRPEPHAPGAVPRYRVDTEVPAHWYPLAPEQLSDHESVRLRLVALARGADGDAGPARPLGALLAAARSGKLWLQEEEVARAGVALERAHQRARWHDGSPHDWLARRRSTGTGESSSGLRFDGVEGDPGA